MDGWKKRSPACLQRTRVIGPTICQANCAFWEVYRAIARAPVPSSSVPSASLAITPSAKEDSHDNPPSQKDRPVRAVVFAVRHRIHRLPCRNPVVVAAERYVLPGSDCRGVYLLDVLRPFHLTSATSAPGDNSDFLFRI